MEHYRNSSGASGVYAYEIGNDNIKVKFKDGAVYLYTNSSAGRSNIAKMKSLAIGGQGLNSFINTAVKKQYASRLR